jgi:hypothetical protein
MTNESLFYIRGRIAAYKVLAAQCANEIKQLEGTIRRVTSGNSEIEGLEGQIEMNLTQQPKENTNG